jgi:hypothetical protein
LERGTASDEQRSFTGREKDSSKLLAFSYWPLTNKKEIRIENSILEEIEKYPSRTKRIILHRRLLPSPGLIRPLATFSKGEGKRKSFYWGEGPGMRHHS